MSKPKGPVTAEEARAEAIRSYEHLMDKVFANVTNDIRVAMESSLAFSATGQVLGREDDKARGDADAQAFAQLLEAVETVRSAVSPLVITEGEWRRLDRALGNEGE